MQTKELLSQDEISALLDTSPAAKPEGPKPPQNREPDAVFEDMAAEMLRYLQGRGLPVEKVAVVQKSAIGVHRRKSFRGRGLVCHLSIEDRLASAFTESLLGGNCSRFEEERVAGSLEEPFLSLFFREAEKLLQPHLQRIRGFGSVRQEHFLEFSLGNTKSVMKLVVEGVATAGAEEQVKTGALKIEAVLGVVCTNTLAEGKRYKLEEYTSGRIVLVMDNALAFRCKIVQTTNDKMRLLLEEPLLPAACPKGFLVCAAGGFPDDDVLLTLHYGGYLELKLYDEVQIHKEGRFVAKAELFINNGDIAVAIV